MTAHVTRLAFDGQRWLIAVVRDHELTVDRTQPALSDLPADVAQALRDWLRQPTRQRPEGTR